MVSYRMPNCWITWLKWNPSLFFLSVFLFCLCIFFSVFVFLFCLCISFLSFYFLSVFVFLFCLCISFLSLYFFSIFVFVFRKTNSPISHPARAGSVDWSGIPFLILITSRRGKARLSHNFNPTSEEGCVTHQRGRSHIAILQIIWNLPSGYQRQKSAKTNKQTNNTNVRK